MPVDKQTLLEIAERSPVEYPAYVFAKNSVERWVKLHNIEAGSKLIPCEVVYTHYLDWCVKTEEKQLSYIEFFRKLSKLLPPRGKGRHYLSPSPFDLSWEFYFRARQVLLRVKNPLGRIKGRKPMKRKNEEI